MDFIKEAENLVNRYPIYKEHAECYLANFIDEYICKNFTNGCKNYMMCQMIEKCENYRALLESATEEIENLYEKETALSIELKNALKY